MCEHMLNWSWDVFFNYNKQTNSTMLIFSFNNYSFLKHARLFNCLPTRDVRIFLIASGEQNCWFAKPCPFSQKRKYSQCSRYFSRKLRSHSCNSLSMYPARGFMEPLGAQQTGQYSNMPFARTNNDIEGWHHSLNRRASGRGQLPMYLLITLLHREAMLTAIQIRLVSEKKLRRIQRHKCRDLRAKILICGTSLTPVKDQRNVYL